MLAFFIDGTDMSISGFDKKKEDVAGLGKPSYGERLPLIIYP